MLIKIVGLNSENFFYLVKERGAIGWKPYKKPIADFIRMMFILFPNLKKESETHNLHDKYDIAVWLYNYGETPIDKVKGNAYIHFYHR